MDKWRPVRKVSDFSSSPNQYMQVSEQAGQMWSQHQAQSAMQKMPMQMPVKQSQQQPYYMPPQDPLKLFEHQLQSVPMQPPQSSQQQQHQQQPTMDKKMKYPDVKMQDFYWEPPYRMGDNRSMMGERMGAKRPPVGFCPDHENMSRGPPFEVSGLLQNSYFISESH